jgi:hypothetical protein
LEASNGKNAQNITEKLCEMLAHFTKGNINAVNIKSPINFCLALKGSNAPIEPVFFMVNALWSVENTDLK